MNKHIFTHYEQGMTEADISIRYTHDYTVNGNTAIAIDEKLPEEKLAYQCKLLSDAVLVYKMGADVTDTISVPFIYDPGVEEPKLTDIGDLMSNVIFRDFIADMHGAESISISQKGYTKNSWVKQFLIAASKFVLE